MKYHNRSKITLLLAILSLSVLLLSSLLSCSSKKQAGDTKTTTRVDVVTSVKPGVTTDSKVTTGSKVTTDSKVTTGSKVTTDSTVTTDSKVTTGSTVTTDSKVTTESPQQTTAPATTTVPEIEWPVEHDVVYLEEEVLRDKILGSWIGQMIGVSWAASTEFKYNGVMMTENQIPAWTSALINNAFSQDDLYVEIPFIDAMKEHGTDATVEKIAPYFRDTNFMLWHANYLARLNLRNGVDPALAGHYLNNYHADDIDWQIEADFLGNIFPGIISVANNRAFDIGHMICYGDGVYGGVFITAMHSAAMVYDDLDKVIEIGINSIPEGTKFRSLLDDVVACYKQGKTFAQCWKFIQDKWASDDKCPELQNVLNIDAKLNAGYVLIGLLWGEGDFEETIKISMRCGQDSDCNPSSAAAVLGTLYGLEGIPEKFKSAANYDGTKFSYTDYTLNDCVNLSLELAEQALLEGGAVKAEGGYYVVRELKVTPVAFEQWPDDSIYLYLETENIGNGEITLKTSVVTPKGLSVESAKYALDMGNGIVFDMLVPSYRYTESGEYTIKCTVTIDGKSAQKEITVKVDVPTHPGFNKTASVSVTNPNGGGNKDISVIIDGYMPSASSANDQKQYDTFTFAEKGDEEEWYAITFDHKVSVTEVIFCEGNHFNNGGWFARIPRVEVYVNGEWVSVESTMSPDYPSENTQTGQGAIYEKFVFTLKEAALCEGVRVIGKPGGTAKFITCSELDVRFDFVENPTYEDNLPTNPVEDATIVVAVDSPSGAGCKDTQIIRDGYIPKPGDNNSLVQYDTYKAATEDHDEYFGYIFTRKWDVSKVIFTSGGLFHDGGWFKDGTLKLQLYINGEWVDAECTVTPEYPNSNISSDFSAFTSYTFEIEATSCMGIRVIGSAGGGARFTSISELSVEGTVTK